LTLRAKLVALVVGLTALVLLGVGAFLWQAFEGWSAEAVDRDLLERAGAIAALVELEEGEARLEVEEHAEALLDPAHPYRVRGPAGPLGGSRAPLPWPELAPGAPGPVAATVADPSGRRWRVLSAPFQVVGREGQARVEVQVAGASSAFGALEGPFRRGLLLALLAAQIGRAHV